MSEQHLKNTSIRTTCPYCGVGCGVIAEIDDGRVKVIGDKQHPANFGRLCSKGSALDQTLNIEGRLLTPKVSGQSSDWESALSTVAERFQEVIKNHGADAIAFYVSGQLLTEDYYVANKLMKGYMGSANIDTNSRLCMSSSVAGHKRAFGSDTVPGCYEDLEKAKLIVLVGSNTAWCHPVLYQRINQAKQNNPDLVVVVIDPRRTATCDIADLHLAITSGTDALLFNGLLVHLSNQGEMNELFVNHFTQGHSQALSAAFATAPAIEGIAVRCGVSEQDIAEFYRIFARTERVVTVYSQGINQSSSGTDKVNAIINCHLFTGRIGRAGMGPFSFTGQPNAMGGREVGGLANMLAAHMEINNEHHRTLVQTFWKSPTICHKPGLKAVDLFREIESGKIKALWVMATNPVVSMPDADRVRAALEKCEFVVVSECVENTDTTEFADVVLPAATWGEKDGTVTNSERRISRQRRFHSPAGDAKPDWWIVCEVAKRMGFKEAFNYRNSAEIFREHAALSGFENDGERDFDLSGLMGLTDKEYDDFKPSQWPIRKHGESTSRMFANGSFFTASGKAQFVNVEPRLPINLPDNDFPFILNTGRVRDQWHTMTRTGKVARLCEHSPEPYADIHPQDASSIGISDGELMHIFSRWGEVIVRARVNDQQQPKNLFVPMHWNEQFSSLGRIGAVVNPETDPISGQPEFKHTPVRVIVYKPVWYGFLLTRRKIDVDDVNYWAVSKSELHYRYELAGEQSPEDWANWARSKLCTSDDDVNWVEYLDKKARRYRGVRMVSGRVESCVFIAPNQELPARSWLASLFSESMLSDESRKSLLLGKSPVGQKDVGRIVCACFSVGYNTILDTIETQELCSAEEIGEALKAGTNCGSCVPELKSMLKQVSGAAL